jgi:hypothetical protein
MAVDTYDPANVDAAVAQIRARVAQTAQTWGKQAEARMRATALWHDRNGPSLTGYNARQSLRAETAIAANGDVLVILSSDRQTLTPWRQWSNGAPVGAFLELSTRYMASRAVIWPTAQALAPQLTQQLRTSIG